MNENLNFFFLQTSERLSKHRSLSSNLILDESFRYGLTPQTLVPVFSPTLRTSDMLPIETSDSEGFGARENCGARRHIACSATRREPPRGPCSRWLTCELSFASLGIQSF